MTSQREIISAWRCFVGTMADAVKVLDAALRDAELTLEDKSESGTALAPVIDRAPDVVHGDLGISSRTAEAKHAASPPAFSPARATPVWTAERLELLRRDYCAGVDVGIILERANALPGAPVKRKSIAVEAARHGWRRPAKEQDTSPPLAPIPPQATPKAAPERWTPARKIAAKLGFEDGDPMPDLLAKLNALSGAPLTVQDVNLIAAARGWRRGVIKATSAPLEPVGASFQQIAQWGAERGIQTGRKLPIGEINARRQHLGLAPFALIIQPSAPAR